MTTTFSKSAAYKLTSEVSSATPSIAISTGIPHRHRITALAVDVTSFTTNLTGTPVALQSLILEIVSTGTRNITWGAAFENGGLYTLPTVISGATTIICGFVWNAATSKFKLVALDS